MRSLTAALQKFSLLEHVQFLRKLNVLKLSCVGRIFERKTGFHLS
jgi:hypothetical protein